MFNLINKINFSYKGLLNRSSISFEKKGIKPKKHWISILLSSFILMAILIAVAFYIYTKINNGTLFSKPETQELGEIEVNKILLDKVVKDFDDREAKLQEIRGGKPIPPDPSR